MDGVYGYTVWHIIVAPISDVRNYWIQYIVFSVNISRSDIFLLVPSEKKSSFSGARTVICDVKYLPQNGIMDKYWISMRL